MTKDETIAQLRSALADIAKHHDSLARQYELLGDEVGDATYHNERRNIALAYLYGITVSE